MPAWLYLPPACLGQPSEQWRLRFGQTPEDEHIGSLSEAAERLAAGAVTLILPVELATWCRTAEPIRRGRWQRQAVAFAVEEQLGEELDHLHLALGTTDAEGRCAVLAIQRQTLESLLATFNEAGLRIRAAHIDADLLPVERPRALWLDGRWLLGGALPARLAVPGDELPLLEPLLPQELHSLSPEPASAAALLAGRAQAIDLCQGPFAVRRRERPWAAIGAFLLALLALSPCFDLARGAYLDAQAERLHGESVARFRQLYPEQTRIVDLAAQWRANQTQAQQPTALAPRLAHLATLLLDGNVRTQRLDFDAEQGWSLEVRAPTFADLERLRERARAAGLDAQLGAASRTEEGVSARVSIKE